MSGLRVHVFLATFAILPVLFPAKSYAVGRVSAGGKVDVTANGNTNPTATSSTCATAEVGNVVGGAANFTTVFQPVNPNNPCVNTVFDKTGAPVAKYAGIGKIGASAVPKFPGGLGSSLTSVMTLGGGVNPDRTVAQGTGGFISTVTSFLFFTSRTAQLSASASVTKPTALAPAGVATGASIDP
jgi:hypothetical protein